jgi:hypothetical protein
MYLLPVLVSFDTVCKLEKQTEDIHSWMKSNSARDRIILEDCKTHNL